MHLVFPAALSLTACGGAPTAVEPPKTTPTTETTQVAVAQALDLSPVSQPKNVLVVVRANDISKSIASIDRIVKLPRSLKTLVGDAMAEKNGKFISLDGSFDVAAALDPASSDKDPKFLWAVSIPVKSVEEAAEAARKDGDEVRSSTPGAYRSRTKTGTTCDITPAPGNPGARIVCSDDEEGLRELSPFLSRGVSIMPKKPVDLWLRAEAGPLKERYMPFLRAQADEAIGEVSKGARNVPMALDPELLDVPSVLAREGLAFVEDTDSLEMSFALDASKPEMRVVSSLGFKSRTSWVTELVAKSLEHPEPPPEMFFRLPNDAMTGTWSRSADPIMFAGIRRVLHKAAGSGLAFLPMLNDQDRQAFVGWLDGFPSFSGTWVSSSGGPMYKPELKGKLTAAQAIEQAKETAKHWLPWGISGGEGDPKPMIDWLKQSEVAWNRGVAVVKKEAGKNAQKDLALLPQVKFSASVAGYPKGSASLDVEFKFSSKDVWSLLSHNKFQQQPGGDWGQPEHPKGAEARGSLTLQIVVVPEDSGHYWFGYSVDPDALKKHLLASMKGAPAKGTLAARTDLDILKNHKGFGGFLSYGTLLDSLKNTELSSSDARDLSEAIQAMPHKGQSPLFLLGSGTGGTTPSMQIELVAQKDWVEDMSGVIQHFVAKELDHGKRTDSGPQKDAVPTSVASTAKLPKECRDYLALMEKCVAKVPESSRAALQQSLDASREAFASAAATPAAIGPLSTSCKSALDALKSRMPCK